MKRPKPGDYWKRVWNGIVIYGHAMTLQEIEDQERRLGADADELAFTMRQMERQMNNGFIWGMAWSVACPEGELGFTPVREAMKVSKEEFENARSDDWSA